MWYRGTQLPSPQPLYAAVRNNHLLLVVHCTHKSSTVRYTAITIFSIPQEYSTVLVKGVCMYVCVCMVVTYSRVWINRVRLTILLVVS